MAVQSFDYVIVGGGMAADSAVKGLILSDRSRTVCMIGDEIDPPYNRPPLSKSLWSGLSIEEVMRPKRSAVSMVSGREIVELDVGRKFVRDNRGEIYKYGRLLLATGCRPRRLPGKADRVIYYRTLADFRRLWELAQARQPITIVGSGLIGAEMAGVLSKAGSRVTVLGAGAGFCAGLLPAALSTELTLALTRSGVTFMPDARVTAANASGAQIALSLASGAEIVASNVIAGLGVLPNEALAVAAGIRCDGGIMVDEYLQTSVADVFAAGDVARFRVPELDRWLRSEHEENANFSGLAAGRSMAGAREPFQSMPYMYSNVLDFAFEGIGVLDASLHTIVERGAERSAVVYYVEGSKVRGVLFWNARSDVEAAQDLICSGQFDGHRISKALPVLAN